MAELFPVVRRPRRAPRPRRVLACLADAGDRYRAYRCQACSLEWPVHLTRDQEEASAEHFERYGTDKTGSRMCPRCNGPEVFTAWGETPDAHSDGNPGPTPEEEAEMLRHLRALGSEFMGGWGEEVRLD